MSAVKETYGYNNDRCRLIYRYSITGILTNQEELLEKQNILLEEIEAIMNKAFASAEEEIKKELYKKGLMTCNAYLESIEEMRIHGNDLVQAHIKELDEKYGKLPATEPKPVGVDMNKIYAKCIQESDNDCSWLKHDLEVGQLYEVQDIYMGQSCTSIILKDRKQAYNSVYFEFYENGKELDIYSDKRFNPYL